MSFLDARLERCEIVDGEILLRGVVVVAVSSGLEVVDSVVLMLLDFERRAEWLERDNSPCR